MTDNHDDARTLRRAVGHSRRGVAPVATTHNSSPSNFKRKCIFGIFGCLGTILSASPARALVQRLCSPGALIDCLFDLDHLTGHGDFHFANFAVGLFAADLIHVFAVDLNFPGGVERHVRQCFPGRVDQLRRNVRQRNDLLGGAALQPALPTSRKTNA